MSAPPDGDHLDELRARADRERTADAWLAYTRALAGTGDALAAMRVLRQLARSDPHPADPQLAADRAAFLQNCGAYALEHGMDAVAGYFFERALAVPTDGTRRDEVGRLARAALAHIVAERERREADRLLHTLQRDALAERIEDDDRGGSEHYRRLAWLTLQVGAVDRWGSRVASAVVVLDEGVRRRPDDVALLEDLATVLTAAPGTGERVDETLLAIERLDPSSVTLQRAAGYADPTDLSARQLATASFLQELAAGPDHDEAGAALVDLRNRVAGTPFSRPLRHVLVRALARAGRSEEARVHVDLLVEVAGSSHVEHYNVANTLLALGDDGRAAEHAELARTYATDDDERRDADALLAGTRAR